MEDESKKKKQDPSFWEYQAPHYFDFSNLESMDNAENDSYFLNDHEKENMNLSNQKSLSEHFLSLDESNEILDEYFSPECKHYSFRQTPLRALHKSGGTPFKESRVSAIFGKRKSTHTKKTVNTFDLSSIENALDNCDKENCNQINNGETETIVEEKLQKILDQDLSSQNDESLPINKSNRLSYVVKSPVVVSKPSVHFDLSTLPDVVPDGTPGTVEIKNCKVRNRQPTPGRLDRTLKYIKRFSGTPNKVDKKVEVTEVKMTDNVKAEIAPTDTNINLQTKDDQKENEKPKEESKPKQLISKKNVSMVKVPPVRPSSVLAFKRSFVPKSEVRFISLAEFSNNFCNSVRTCSKYEPTIRSKTMKKTKPKSPKLWTSKRVHNNCPKAAIVTENKIKLNNVNNQKTKPKPTTTTTMAIKKINNHQSQILAKPKGKILVSFNKKKSLTKAQTPIFCTDIRSKIYNSKHDDQDKKQDEPRQTFRARPMPNFQKIHARAIERKPKVVNSKI